MFVLGYKLVVFSYYLPLFVPPTPSLSHPLAINVKRGRARWSHAFYPSVGFTKLEGGGKFLASNGWLIALLITLKLVPGPFPLILSV
jgi:hypothetical protein